MKHPKSERRWLDDPTHAREADLLRSLTGDMPPGFEERLWRRLKTQPRAMPRWTWAVVPVSAALLIVGLTFVVRLRVERGPMELALVEGTVQVSDAKTAQRTLRAGAQVPLGALMHTRGGRSVVRVRDVGTLLLSNDSSVKLNGSVEAPRLQLHSGRLVAVVASRKDRSPLVVHAGDYQIDVVGTAFEVERCGGAAASVRVWEGTVRVAGPDGSVLVHSGEMLPCATGGTTDPRDLVLAWKMAERDGPVPATDALHEVSFKVTFEEASPALTSDEPTAASTPSPRVRVRRPSATPVVRKASAPPKSAEEREDELYQQARAERDPQRAMVLFDAVVALKGRHAALAAYQAARLSMKFDLSAAARRFEAFVEHDPKHVLVEEARISLVECRLGLGQLAAAEAALAPLFGHTSGRAAELHFLRAEIARQLRHDCGRALGDYETALGSGRRVEDALYYKAWCLYDLRRDDDGRRMLERYLTEYPRGRHTEAVRRRLQGP